ncbi:MAG: class II aldolase/adducin family protein [Alphaproteobacteria bacterium]|jgi:ribulose-5-phosphate 4-epimerase/fuculose-1-phosphate aldolase|nr:class II aldolase/adducin family protein [Alphaproteobacteria bacterium]MDP6813876.1 class II aldolase/adducin family protein [Alphaproteobacteria bacterium]
MSLAAGVIDRSNSVSAAEWEQRVKLAAVYRIFARLGWDDLIYTHISARVPGPEGHFLINPFGLMYEEVTASNLVKIDLAGERVDPDEPNQINYAGYIIHSAVHEVHAAIHCVIHLHTDAGVAVASQRDGLLPLSQFNLFQYGGVAYHDYEGLALDADEKQRLVADLGECRMMILRNHGTLTVGETVEEAFFHMYNLERACAIQIAARAGGAELALIPEAVMAEYRRDKPVGSRFGGFGALELAAWMRKLDRQEPDFRS